MATLRPNQIERALFALKFGAMVLGDKVILFVALFLDFALFGYSVLYPDLTRFAIAGMFSITTFLPMLHYHEKRKGNVQQIQEQEAA